MVFVPFKLFPVSIWFDVPLYGQMGKNASGLRVVARDWGGRSIVEFMCPPFSLLAFSLLHLDVHWMAFTRFHRIFEPRCFSGR